MVQWEPSLDTQKNIGGIGLVEFQYLFGVVRKNSTLKAGIGLVHLHVAPLVPKLLWVITSALVIV
jgi:hypothetical protein